MVVKNSAPSSAPRELSGNLFFDALPAASAARLQRHVEHIALPEGAVVAKCGTPIPFVVFPINAMVSTVISMVDGKSVEVALVGREGLVGVSLAFGDTVSSTDSFVQVPDGGFRIETSVFVDALRTDRELNAQFLNYVHATASATAQFAACNRLHGLNERCSRWLLMAHDRTIADEINLTQEYLSDMLGVRRAGVSLAAAALAQAGFITYRRGHISILNRSGLLDVACECYAVVTTEFERLLGYASHKARSAESAF